MNFEASFIKESEELTSIAETLLAELEPEPSYVKNYIRETCDAIKEKGWIEQAEDQRWVRSFERSKYLLKIAFIHARRGEHITGADLAFELKDKKILFVQSKRVGSNGRFQFNRLQLLKLGELEAQICGYPSMCLMLPCPPYLFRDSPAAFYHLIMAQRVIDERFLHISEVSFVLAGNKSISQREFLGQGLRKDEFQELFWDCSIGGPDMAEDKKREILYLYSLYTNRLIIWLDVERA